MEKLAKVMNKNRNLQLHEQFTGISSFDTFSNAQLFSSNDLLQANREIIQSTDPSFTFTLSVPLRVPDPFLDEFT
jgi:hypothetical protein